jgi:hypothetical protein
VSATILFGVKVAKVAVWLNTPSETRTSVKFVPFEEDCHLTAQVKPVTFTVPVEPEQINAPPATVPATDKGLTRIIFTSLLD